jgi:hypothetical protein
MTIAMTEVETTRDFLETMGLFSWREEHLSIGSNSGQNGFWRWTFVTKQGHLTL